MDISGCDITPWLQPPDLKFPCQSLLLLLFARGRALQVRGIFNGATRPLSITAAAAAHGLDAKMVARTLKEMVASGKVIGELDQAA